MANVNYKSASIYCTLAEHDLRRHKLQSWEHTERVRPDRSAKILHFQQSSCKLDTTEQFSAETQ